MDLLNLQINIYQLMITLHFVRSDHTSVSCPSGNYLTENLILESILKVIKHFLALSLIFPPRPLKRSPCTIWRSRTSLGIFFWQCQVILFQGKQDDYKHVNTFYFSTTIPFLHHHINLVPQSPTHLLTAAQMHVSWVTWLKYIFTCLIIAAASNHVIFLKG